MDPKKEAKKADKGARAAGEKAMKKDAQKGHVRRDVKQIVRVMSTDLNGAKKIKTALCDIKGINYNFSHAVLFAAKIDGEKKLSELNEEDIVKIESVIKDPLKFNIPEWMINHRFSYKTGEALHYTGADLMVSLRDELNRLKKIRSYRGIRHEAGLTVRGQRTKGSGRKGVKVGVIKNKELRSKAGAKK